MRSQWRRFFLRLFNFFRPQRAEPDLEREIASHLALMEDEFQRRGMTTKEARLAARRALGGVEQAKELHRDERSFRWLEDARQDLRHAVRMLVRTPGFTAVVVLTIALGIGANTAIFSVVNGVLLKPLPYKDSDQLLQLVENVPAADSPTGAPRRVTIGLSVPELIELRARAKTLSHLGVHAPALMTLTGREETARLEGWRVEPVIFHMLGARPLLGRVFGVDDAAPGADAVIILSYSTWQRHFGGDPNILGQTLTLDGKGYSVIGVMPQAFGFPFELPNRQFWRPLAPTTGDNRVRLPIMARLADGVSMQAAAAEVGAILRERDGRGSSYEFVRIQDELVAPVKSALLVLTVAVGFVLLIACVNVANLLLARTAARELEMAIRATIGAGRGRVIRQLLTESVMLAFLGGAGGTVLAFGGIRLLQTLATTLSRMDLGILTSFPKLNEIAIDASVLAFTIATSVITGVAFGLAPAIPIHVPIRWRRSGKARRPPSPGSALFAAITREVYWSSRRSLWPRCCSSAPGC